MLVLKFKSVDSIGDTYSRQLYQIALETCPKNAKAWGQFAAWSYRQGRKASDWEEDGSTVVVPSENDQRKLEAILGPDTDGNLVASIMAILYERRKTELDDNQLGAILNNMLTSRVEEVKLYSLRPYKYNAFIFVYRWTRKCLRLSPSGVKAQKVTYSTSRQWSPTSTSFDSMIPMWRN